MQKTISIATPDIWEEIKTMADGQSISGYLVSLHRDHVRRQQDAKARADTIQEQIALVDALPDLSADLP